MPFISKPIIISDKAREILEKSSKSRSHSKAQVQRAKILTLANSGLSDAKISKEVGLSRGSVNVWRNRWINHQDVVKEVERSNPEELERTIIELLTDLPGRGVPPTFTGEQIMKLIQLACTFPRDYGYEVSHWTLELLAKEAVKQKIVESISLATVFRFLKDGKNQTTQNPILVKFK